MPVQSFTMPVTLLSRICSLLEWAFRARFDENPELSEVCLVRAHAIAGEWNVPDSVWEASLTQAMRRATT